MSGGLQEHQTGVMLQRARGQARVAFRTALGQTKLSELYQSGCAKVRLPKVHHAAPEAVFLNTAGGLTGGDQIDFSVDIDDQADAVATTQACERIYRSARGSATVANRIRVGERGAFCWLPQETIMFDGGRLSRRFEVDLAPNARLLALEAYIFGRAAMGETVRSGYLTDQWRIRRGGELIFADQMRLDGDVAATLSSPATFGGCHAAATLVMVGDDGEERLGQARAVLAEAAESRHGGASLIGDVLVVRLVAPSGRDLRSMILPLVVALRDYAPLPRVWHT